MTAAMIDHISAHGDDELLPIVRDALKHIR
jgi:hypothetical protein